MKNNVGLLSALTYLTLGTSVHAATLDAKLCTGVDKHGIQYTLALLPISLGPNYAPAYNAALWQAEGLGYKFIFNSRINPSAAGDGVDTKGKSFGFTYYDGKDSQGTELSLQDNNSSGNPELILPTQVVFTQCK